MNALFKSALFFFACVNIYCVSAQISLTNTVTATPVSLDVCGGSATFSYTIDNVSSFALSNNEVVFNLPTGMSYVAGSVTGCTEVDISNLSQPQFSFPDLAPTDPAVVITFNAVVGCDAIAFLQSGGTFENTYDHTYD